MTKNCPSFSRHQSLEASQVIPLFNSVSTTFTSTPPFKPKAGEVYVLKLDIGHENDWRSDGYRWVQIAARRLPTHNPVIKKCYFHAGQKNKKKSKDFEKQAFVSLIDPSKVVVQYLGDENIAEEFPHGNSKKNTKPFFRTRPSLLNKLICDAASNAETVQIFKQYTAKDEQEQENHNDNEGNNSTQIDETSDASPRNLKKKSLKKTIVSDETDEKTIGPEILSRPRNIEQIRNIKRRLARRLVASADEISELYNFSRETPNYIVRFTLIPNIVIVAFSNESMHEFNLLLDHSDLLSQQKILITFDSSYTINTFQVTCVFYRHIALKEEPCILLGCALHTRRCDDVYEYILTHLKQQCPNIESRCLYIIDSDGNTLKNDYLSIFLPNLRIIRTWNYIFSQLHVWLLQNGRTHADYQFYLAEIKSLFVCTDMKTFLRLYDRCKCNWTEEFRTYFEQTIFPLIDTDLGSWILKKYDLFDCYSGIKGLSCEPMQTVSAQLRDWRESRIDHSTVVFYWLQMYFSEELQKAYKRISRNYTLKPSKYDKWAMKAVTSTISHEQKEALQLDQIVEHVRTNAMLSSVHHSQLSRKRSNDQQSLISSPVKRLKTTTLDSTQQPYIITTTNTSNLQPTLLVTTQQPQAMMVFIHRITSNNNSPLTTLNVSTVPSSQQSQKFIIAKPATTLPISQTTTNRLIANTSMYNNSNVTDLTRCLVTTTNSTHHSFVRPTLSTNILRLTVVRK